MNPIKKTGKGRPKSIKQVTFQRNPPHKRKAEDILEKPKPSFSGKAKAQSIKDEKNTIYIMNLRNRR